MRRSHLAVALAALLLVAGCTGGTDAGPAGSDPGTTTDLTTTPGAGVTTPAPPEDASWERVTPATPTDSDHRDLPARPDDLTADSVREYVAAYEEALQYNRAIDGSIGVDASCSVATDDVTELDDGYLVRVTCFVANYQEGTGTRTMHGDAWPGATYFVNESTTLRSSR